MINCAALVLQPMFNNNIDQNNVKKKKPLVKYMLFSDILQSLILFIKTKEVVFF